MASEELEKYAESLGIDVDGRWSDETLQKKIDAIEVTKEVEEVTESVDSYTCDKKNFYILGVKIESSFVLSESQLDNESFMKRFNHAIELGIIND